MLNSVQLINRGLSKFHPSTIVQIYGLEGGTFSAAQLKLWLVQLIATIKGLFCCSNKLLKVFDIRSLQDFLSFKNSILCQQVQSNLHTQSILDNSNIVSCTPEAMNVM